MARLVFLLFAIFAPRTATGAASCPLAQEELRTVPESRIQSICFDAVVAATGEGAQASPTLHYRDSLYQCRSLYLQLKESENVAFATRERLKTFHPDIGGLIDQKTAFDQAARLLLDAHTYVNISMAALYRARLKLRMYYGNGKRELAKLQQDFSANTASRQKAAAAEAQASAQGDTAAANRFRDQVLPALDRDAKAIQLANDAVQGSQACAEREQGVLDQGFDAWARVKAGLLAQNFEKLLPKDAFPDPKLQDIAELKAIKLQQDQRQVYANLTDSPKKSAAFALAEGCQKHDCDLWASMTWGIGWAARTPVVKNVSLAVMGWAAYERAHGEGLGFWQTLKEVGNLATFPLSFLDTEIGAIEKGQVRPFQQHD